MTLTLRELQRLRGENDRLKKMYADLSMHHEILQEWAERNKVELRRHIQPGKPSQNGLIERSNKTLRIECLNLDWCSSMEELNATLQDWSVTYNQVRPHENLGYLSPGNYEDSNKNLHFCLVAA